LIGNSVSDTGRPVQKPSRTDNVLHYLIGHSVSDTGRPGQKCWKIDFAASLLLSFVTPPYH